MTFLSNPLFLLLISPLAGNLVIALLPAKWKPAIRWVALASSLVTFGLAIWILVLFKAAVTTPQMMLSAPWFAINNFVIDFRLGVDGISILMVLLTAFLSPLSILASWRSIDERVKAFMMFFLMLEAGLLGVFLAMDAILFYVFWEFTLIPMYFLIGIWGSGRRIYAALKFFIFTMAGSVLLFVAILFAGMKAGGFAIDSWMLQKQVFAGIQTWLFLAFGIAFAVKVPIFPLHTWLPDAHTEAPTAGSVILAGVLLKMGAYGYLRFNLPLFPQAFARFAPWIGILAIIGILYGSMVALMQKDMKRMVAYSSVAHMGFIMLGIVALTQQSVSGAILQMVNHGLSTGALFLIVGFLYERRHTREFSAYGGLWKVMPILAPLTLIVTLSSLALPGLNGFAGEFNILMGSYRSATLNNFWFTVEATLGVILAAIYLLVMFEKLFLGKVTVGETNSMKDINWREILILAPIILLIFVIGLYPQPIFNLINPTVQSLIAVVP